MPKRMACSVPEGNMNIFVIHSYNGDTADSFAPSVKDFAEKHGLQYIFPDFPIRKEATYRSWSEVMDTYRSDITEDTIIIAHSLGTLFVPKYIAQNSLRIRAYISVAGYMNYEGRKDLEEIMTCFYPSEEEFRKCHELIRERRSLYSDHDRMNDRSKLVHYAQLLDAVQTEIPGAGHFDPQSGIRSIPELEEILTQIIC